MGSAGPVISASALVKRYGAITALAGLDLAVPQGAVYGFLGPNGAGKTTAVKLLLGLTRPTSGLARVLGAPSGSREARRRVGYLPELFRYQHWLNAREVLALHCALAAQPRDLWSRAIGAALQTVGLEGREDGRVGTFSKGMQQRLGLAVALLGEPEVVFLDEPTSALDPVGRHDVREIIRDLRSRGATVFLNSHLLTEVELVCDRIAIVNRGRIIAEGTLDGILGRDEVRVRVTGLDAFTVLAPFGTVTTTGEWLAVRGVAPERVPDLVAALVAAGGRVHAIEPRRGTLEERFLELLGES